MVYPQYWNSEKDIETLKVEFLAKLNILVHHFGRNVKVQGEEIGGILDSSKLYQQASHFVGTMSNQYHVLVKPIQYGVVIKLWTLLGESHYLQENMLEYFKLVDLCQTVVLESLEDKRIFSALSFLKSKLRNTLDNNMDTCLRLYVTKYAINAFLFNRTLELWWSDRERREEYKITNVSNELDR